MLFDSGSFAVWIYSMRNLWVLWGLDRYVVATLIIFLVGLVALALFARDRMDD